MISTIVSRLVILVFGTLYPAYASYKAVRTKNVKEYVKWMMYWIVFALFTCAETFTDVFLSWFPFYYEIKIILVLWLLSPATKGSSILYRKFVHPMLSQREQEIDDYIAKAKEQGYHTVLNLGTKGVNYATNVIMQTAIKGGGGIVNQLKKSYSLGDLSGDSDSRTMAHGQSLDTVDQVSEQRIRRRHSPHRTMSERASSRVEVYFPEMDVRPGAALSHVRSTEDVSSGYSSAEPLYAGHPPRLEGREGLVRTASVGGSSRPRTRSTRVNIAKKVTIPEVSEDSEAAESSETDSEYETKILNEPKITVPQKQVVLISEKTQPVQDINNDTDSDNNVDFVDTVDFDEQSLKANISKKVEVECVSSSNVIKSVDVISDVPKSETEIATNEERMKSEILDMSEKICEKSISDVDPSKDEAVNENIIATEAKVPELEPMANEKENTNISKDIAINLNTQVAGEDNKKYVTLPENVKNDEVITDSSQKEIVSLLNESHEQKEEKIDNLENKIEVEIKIQEVPEIKSEEKGNELKEGVQDNLEEKNNEMEFFEAITEEADKEDNYVDADNEDEEVSEYEIQEVYEEESEDENVIVETDIKMCETDENINKKESVVEEKNNEESESRLEVDNIKAIITEDKPVLDKVVEKEVPKKEEKLDISIPDELTKSTTSLSHRGGKYNKHIAPVPPEKLATQTTQHISQQVKVLSTSLTDLTNKNTEPALEPIKASPTTTPVPSVANQISEQTSHPIKATLVLKPGIIKSIPLANEEQKTVFVHKSPKPKRKAPKRSKSHKESPISRLMMLPKRMFGGGKESEAIKLKAQEDSKSLTVSTGNSSVSDSEGSREYLNLIGNERKSVSNTDIDKLRDDENFEAKKMILRNLSHSPKQYRKNRKDKGFDDSD